MINIMINEKIFEYFYNYIDIKWTNIYINKKILMFIHTERGGMVEGNSWPSSIY
jgi:hypothetical protein